MGKWGSYTQAVKAKLADLFLVKQTNNGTADTYSVTTEQIGETVNGEQTYSDLISTDKTIVGAINEVGSLPDTATGTIATFTTSLEKPLVECEVDQNATKLIQTSGNDNTLNEYIRQVFLGNYGFVDLSTLNWSSVSRTGFDLWTSTGLSSLAKVPTSNANPFNGISSEYTISNYNTVNGTDTPNAIALRTNGTIYLNNGSSVTPPSGYLIYELATPTTPTITTAQFNTLCTAFGIDGDIYDLPVSPLPTTYQGTNNFFTDYNGNVNVTYLETIKEYIDKRVNP